MMNEFPNGFKQAWWDMVQHGGGKTRVLAVCGTEYLELLADAGCLPEHFPPCQPVGQYQIWQKISADNFPTNAVENAIQGIIKTNPNFHVDGAS